MSQLVQDYTQTLIPTFIGELNGEPQPLVNARDLHAFLDSSQHFADWIKNAIADYGFIEDEEFFISLGKTSGFFGGRPKTEYHISLDMAKELAMVQKNAKGRQARRYFIECEKWLKNAPAPQLLAELLKARPMWADILRYKRLGLKTSEIGKLIERAPSTVNEHVRKMAACGFEVANQPKPRQLALGV